ncbi:PorP/SprF family type IX secretion system membrane protein [Brumimicrobium oceani]|uniref:PorP/SprF family type IX secretion system membrane protein n=1 Tax=Brumimicrobium oceani TaxID=2100725 RepID=UPI00130496B1|nr:PorP/SprF family type IX secretion system membrane protein [Brumimicrobium oceani]
MKRRLLYHYHKYFSILIAGIFTFQISAQDFHFSQMKFTPMNVNPSLAGLSGKYNAIAIYRTQWNSVASPYTTLGASFDANLNSPSNRKGFLAGGLNFYHDLAGDLKMTSSNVNFNIAYHLRLNRNSTLGLGVQIGYAQRGLGQVKGYFASQYDGNDFDQSISSGENFGSRNTGYVDVGTGIVFKHNSLRKGTFNANGFMFTAGLAAYHLTRPSYSFIQGGNDDLFIRYSAFVETEFRLDNASFTLLPAVYYQRQGSHQEILFGAYVKYYFIESTNKTNMRNDFSLGYGAFYRFGDAFVNKLLLDFSSYAVGIAYDINISSLTQASKGRGGVEFMFRYYFDESLQRRIR